MYLYFPDTPRIYIFIPLYVDLPSRTAKRTVPWRMSQHNQMAYNYVCNVVISLVTTAYLVPLSLSQIFWLNQYFNPGDLCSAVDTGQAIWKGPENSRRLGLTDFKTIGTKVVRSSALRTGRLYLPQNTPGTHFC